jgi:hypothetical protein
MPTLEFSTEDVEALRYWRFHQGKRIKNALQTVG